MALAGFGFMVNSSNNGRELSALATAVIVVVELDMAVVATSHELHVSPGGVFGHDGGHKGEGESNDGQEELHDDVGSSGP